ncbi:mono/diheme cytochrome c family protein [Duganella sp. 1411]|uniref:c-type cytochrome n=1 Tax=Duganella sp. 1411 TaxID=2806572 RepID=UPI001AEAE2BB|nr:c-type cytochrome [Duganella sp. 1411]MBP1203095.1 mono/diheme cytochrome c family protein [Duganella sp. 1411]
MTTHRRRLVLTTVAATLATLAVLGAAGGAVVFYGGYYDVASTKLHFQPVHTVLERGMRESVQHYARDVRTPASVAQAKIQGAGFNAASTPTPALLRGAGLYRDNCVICHGAPGVAQDDIGKSMQPVPGPLADAARRWRPNELYWITRHGIKMSGMPAWEFHLAEDDLWAVVGFLVALPELSPQAYAAITKQAGAQPRAPRPQRERADAARGRLALSQYACNACHVIPGVTGPETFFGPPLKDLAARKYIAGHLPNDAANLARWIRDPRQINPQTAMPAMNVTESDARDMATYLLAR